MSEMQNATSARNTDSAVLLERLLRRQRILAWSLSTGTLLVTAAFFSLLATNSPVLRHVVYGQTVTVASVAAVSIILAMLLSVALFGWQARRIDAQLGSGRASSHS